MKKNIVILLTAAILLLCGSTTAQTLSVQPIEVQTGEQTEVVVNLTGATTMTALQFNLQLPAGVIATKDGVTLGGAVSDHIINIETLDGGDLLFVLYSMELNTFNDGELLRIPVTVGDNAKTGSGKLYTVRMATTDIESKECADANFTVTVKETPSTIYIETDLTTQFAALTQNTNWKTGAGGTAGYTATEFCPMVKPNGLPEVQMCEFYETNCDREGDLLYQTMTGLPVGTYNIELYGGAAYTFGRGFSSDAFTGDTWNAGDKIESNTGVSLYATTSEGTYGGEIPIYYATNFPDGAAVMKLENVVVGGNGEVKIGMSKTTHSTNWHIIQLKAVVATVDAVLLHGKMIADANAALTDDAYSNVTGTERTALLKAVNDNTNVGEQTADAYKTAIEEIEKALTAFKDAKEAYDAWQQAKGDMAARSYPYATTTKRNAAESALKNEPTTATEAGSMTATLIQAYRQYAESSAMLESVESRVDVTNTYIQNPKAETAIDADVWQTVKGDGSGGSITIRSDEPWTDGEGNSTHSYFDGGDWGASAWDVTLKQDMTLPVGRYQLTALGRSSADVTLTLFANDVTEEMAHIGNTGGLFNRGWEQTSIEFELTKESPVSIGVRGVTSAIYNWMSFSDFRLVRFNNIPNSIIDINGTQKVNGEIYDLNGRRVCRMTKGIYIINGQKVVK